MKVNTCMVIIFFTRTISCSAKLDNSNEFVRRTIGEPKIYHDAERRQILPIEYENRKRIDNFTICYQLNGKSYLLDLELNKDLIPSNFILKYQHNGRNIVKRPKNLELCHYVGRIRNVTGSWAALSTCRGLRGVIFDGSQMHSIKPENHTQGPHVVFENDVYIVTNHTCGDNEEKLSGINVSDKHIPNINSIKFKRSINPTIKVRSSHSNNDQSRYIELVLVVDNELYEIMGSSLKSVYIECKDIVNIVNSVYSSLNIFVYMSGIVVWTNYNEISISSDGDNVLNNFLHFRKVRLNRDIPNDNAQLLTLQDFEFGAIGKALVGVFCTQFSGGVNTYNSEISKLAINVAHSIGHNLGMRHDNENCVCPDTECIMTPIQNNSNQTNWSSCSVEDLKETWKKGMDSCLKNKPEKLFESPVCGNGFVEPGEQCDCGLSKSCSDNHCCNPRTCKLYSNATCATGECCDLKTCQLSFAGKLCRVAKQECDLPEYCTGDSEFCPDDVFKMNTEKCGNGEAFCYLGHCTSRSDQCRLLWGPTGNNSDDQCYQMNLKGIRHGNCGYDWVREIYTKCSEDDIFCGRLQCTHSNDRLEYGLESTSILSHHYINSKGSILSCKTAIVDLTVEEIDPGLVPNGAKCGDEKMCVNQKCKSIFELREEIRKIPTSICPSICSNNGVCNTLGHCHCNDGFGPPYCNYIGLGGSQDSGPANYTNMT